MEVSTNSRVTNGSEEGALCLRIAHSKERKRERESTADYVMASLVLTAHVSTLSLLGERR